MSMIGIETRPSGVVVTRHREACGHSEEYWSEYRNAADKIRDLEWRAKHIEKLAQTDLATMRWTLENDVRQWQGVNRPVLLTKLAEVERLRRTAIYRRNMARRAADEASALRARTAAPALPIAAE